MADEGLFSGLGGGWREGMGDAAERVADRSQRWAAARHDFGEAAGRRLGALNGDVLGATADGVGATASAVAKPAKWGAGKVKGLFKGAIKLGVVAGLIGTAALLLPGMGFGRKKGADNAVADGAQAAVAANDAPPMPVAQGPLLPPLPIQMPEPPIMEPAATSAVSRLGISKIGGSYAPAMATQKEMGGELSPS